MQIEAPHIANEQRSQGKGFYIYLSASSGP
jgi:hypothetical protein